MASPGTLRFPEVAVTPTPPPAGYTLMYVKTDNVVYILDENGIEVALGSASAITQLTGEATAVGPGSAVITLSNSAVIGKVLTGFTSGPNSVVIATDSILQAIQKLQAQVSGTSGTAITSLTGDVTATGPGAAAATVVTVGGSLAADINTATIAANAATSANTANTIVKRDGSGNFSAGTITATLNGSATSFSGNLVGDVTGTQGATVVSTVGGKTASQVSTSVDDTLAATNLNTASTIVKRDASGNFSAGTITANLTGNVTGLVNGVDAAAHASRHLPSGADAITTASAVTLLPDQANATGTANAFARADHIHNIPSGPAVQIGTTNFAGSAASFSLSDHVHAHGNQTSPTLHAAATSIANGFMPSTDKTKLDASTSANTPSTLVQRDGSGNFSAGTITATLNGSATSFSGNLVGDVTGTQGATVVSTVGGKTAAQVSTSVDDTLAATNLSTSSTIVKRDSSGATHLKRIQLDGTTSGTLAVTVPAITTSHTLTLPAAQGAAGTYLANDGAGNLSWSNPVVNIDGGVANSVYVSSQVINGGTA